MPVRCEIWVTRSTIKLRPRRRCDDVLDGTGTNRAKVVSILDFLSAWMIASMINSSAPLIPFSFAARMIVEAVGVYKTAMNAQLGCQTLFGNNVGTTACMMNK